MNFVLPWPPSVLNPNVRSHWRKHASAKKAYRLACAMTARSQGGRCLTAGKLAVGLVFVPPDRRYRDVDNLISAMKSGLDGLADALGVDDRLFRLLPAPELLEAAHVGGFVRVVVVAW